MFFKRLRISGFKSFAQRTEITLQPGITVVVGPNGCGKSNVFDSILWALGEQRAKALRGAKMGDVIFAGSSGQKAANLCEVTLEIGNAAGHLPTDASELEFTRRLWKTGESEYLINDRPARLRDIQHLMLGTGLGQNSYAVMQQGRMDGIINARPESRRYLIEEAAGISKYQVQKEEALRRLERTDEDLSRINDLVNEVKRNAGKLRKQAERAREYQDLTSRLRAYEMVLLARRFEDLIHEREEAEIQFEDLRGRLGGLDARIAELEKLSEGGREEMAELMALLEAAQRSQQELTRERDQAESRLKVLHERLEQIASRRERLRIELDTLGGTSSSHAAEVTTLEEEQRRLRIEIREGDLQLERKVAQIEGLREGATEHEQELANVRESQATMQADRAQVEAELRVAKQQIDAVRDRATNGGGRVAEFETQYKEAARLMEEARQAAFAIRDDYEKNGNALTEKRDHLARAEARQRELKDRREETANALRDARSRLNTLKQMQESYDSFGRGVKEVMQAADRNALRGVIGVVANLVRPHKGTEKAIEVALGGALQNVVVESGQDGKECIAYLKKRDSGRATFLPLDLVQPRPNNRDFQPVMRMAGVVGWATELVDFDPHISPAIQMLLGNTVVVEHLDVALTLERKGMRTKYVTLDGDLLNPSGAMTGGSYKATGLLSREGEIAALTEAAEGFARQLVEIDGDLDRLESSVAGYRRSIAELQEQNTKLQVALAGSVKDAQVHEQRAKELEARYVELREQVATADDERQALEDKIRLDGEMLADLAAQLGTLSRRAEELGKAQGSRGKLIDEIGQAVQELRIGLAQKRERISAGERAIERLKEESGRQRETLATREEELAKLDAEEKAAVDERDALNARMAELTERHETLTAEVKKQSADRQERVAALQKLIEEQRAAERDRAMMQNDLHDADLRRAQKDTQLEALDTQAREKFEAPLHDVLASLEAELEQMASARAAAQPAETAPAAPGAQVIEVSFAVADADDHAPDHPDSPAAAAESDDPEQSEAARAKWLNHPLAQMPMESLQAEAQALRERLREIGPVSLEAIQEYERVEERLAYMGSQQKDLISARDTILKTVQKIDETTAKLFRECFDTVREYFIENFRRLFGGGRADLVLTDPDNLHETGIEIVAQPPGKKPQTITLLSGGEKCLTAIGLMFALFQWKPSPFCVLDEIDAPLDDANVERFKVMIREFSASTQFIIITHNKLTMELADTIFGITMEEPGVSKVVSVRFDEIDSSGLLDEPATAAAPAPQAAAG